MSPQSKGKNKKTSSVIERPGINWKLGENPQEGSSLILSVVKEAAMLAPIATLKQAACSALLIFKTTQVCISKEQWMVSLELSRTEFYCFIDSQGKQRGVRTTWLRFWRAHHCHLALV